MSARKNRLIFCSQRSLVKVCSPKIPLITCRNQMRCGYSVCGGGGCMTCYQQHPRKAVPQTGWCLQRICYQWSPWTNFRTRWRPTWSCLKNFHKNISHPHFSKLTWPAPAWRRLPTHQLKTTLGARICCESGGAW